jgi:hypothetical protein
LIELIELTGICNPFNQPINLINLINHTIQHRVGPHEKMIEKVGSPGLMTTT